MKLIDEVRALRAEYEKKEEEKALAYWEANKDAWINEIKDAASNGKTKVELRIGDDRPFFF